jgi:DNA-binding MarR family transcriptional regulator
VAVLAQVRRLQPVTVTDLALQLGSERSAVARDLTVLERDGLVTVEPMPGDRRAREVRLTSTGEQRLSAAAPAWRSAQEQITAALGAGRVDDLVRLSSSLVAALTGVQQRGPSRARDSGRI